MIKADIEQLIKPVVENLEYQFWGCEFLVQGKHSLLRIYIDKAEGITVDDCSAVSRQINALLEVEGLIRNSYSLEVSSPGIYRTLFCREQYQQYIGSSIEIKLNKALNESKKLCGSIQKVEENAVTLQVADAIVEVPFHQIVKANLIGE